MRLTRNQAARRAFYLGVPATPVPAVQISKDGGSWGPARNLLAPFGNGWFFLDLTPFDTDTIGPLAYWFPDVAVAGLPSDEVKSLEHGHIDQDALNAAFADLALGFLPNEGLGTLLQRPLYQFLISLQ